MSASEKEAPTPGVPVSELSYAEASRELDSIVEFFEQREVDVDQLVARLERATAIVDELDRRVRRTRAQVEELVPRLEAVSRQAPTGEGRDVDTVGSVAGATDTDDGADHDDEDDEDHDDEAVAEDDLEEELEVWDDEADVAVSEASGEQDTHAEQPLF